MTLTPIRALAALHDHLIDDTAPDAELALRAGQLACDPAMDLMLSRVSVNRDRGGAVLWQRVADHLTGKAEAQVLVLGAVCAFNAHDHDTLSAIVARHRDCVERDFAPHSAIIDLFARRLAATTGTAAQL